MIRSRLRRLEAIVDQLKLLGRAVPASPRIRVQTPQDVIDLIEEQVAALRAETMLGTVERARAIAYLAGIARKAMEANTLAARVEILERVLQQRKEKPRR